MRSKFFQNTKCRFFPCHKTGDISKFNCLMCFCPLYYIDDCGGDFTLIKNIKDCTNCIKNHTDYDFVINKIIEYNKTK